MKKRHIDIGAFITSKTVHHVKVSGHVTALLTNTIVITDADKQSHVIKKDELKNAGYTISKKNTQLKSHTDPLG